MSEIKNFKMYINGEWVESSSGKKIETLNPETNKVWATVPEASEADVDKAVKGCTKSFRGFLV
jgi:aldehyde dehydrogenase (NAD+)/betaine-aldehyde dehydrogenase